MMRSETQYTNINVRARRPTSDASLMRAAPMSSLKVAFQNGLRLTVDFRRKVDHTVDYGLKS
jgi:hypothetical protein